MRWLGFLLTLSCAGCRCREAPVSAPAPDVLWVNEENGSAQVFRWSADGGGRPLTSGPTWSFTTPVGLLVEVRPETQQERLVRLDGQPLTDWSLRARNPSQANGRLVYEADWQGLSNLVLRDDAGSRLVTDARHGDFEPALQGQTISFTSSRSGSPGIYRLELGDGGITTVFDGPAEDTAPHPHPEGRRIAFLSNASGPDEPFLIELGSGSAPIRLAKVGVKDLHWHPDGQRLFFTYQRATGQAGVGFVTLGREGINSVSPPRGDDELGDISDDGKWLAISSTRDGNKEIYLVPTAGGEARRLTTSSSPDSKPVFVRSL